jgi:hypothetical protein
VAYASPTLAAARSNIDDLFSGVSSGMEHVEAEHALMPFDVTPLGMELPGLTWLTPQERSTTAQTDPGEDALDTQASLTDALSRLTPGSLATLPESNREMVAEQIGHMYEQAAQREVAQGRQALHVEL